jgi:hypothetical protein
MDFGGLIRVGPGFIDKFKVDPTNADHIIVIQFAPGDGLPIHEGSIGTALVLQYIFAVRLDIRRFSFFNAGMAGADHRIVDKYIAIRAPADGKSGFVEGAFVNGHPVMQLDDQCHWDSPSR